MLKHIVVFEFMSDAPADTAANVMQALRALPAAIPEIVSLDAGENVVKSERNFDLGLIVEFKNRAALDTYIAHPAHVAAVENAIKPLLERLVVVDFES